MGFDSKDLSKHICTLKAQGLDDCIKSLSDNPVIECKHCGAKANSLKNICSGHLGWPENDAVVTTKELPGDGFRDAY